jgi:ligand-binding sensor domain-containing protein
VNSLAVDAAGNLWMGTTGGVCRRAAEGRPECLPYAGGFPGDTVHALLVARDGALYAGTLTGLWRIALAGGAPRVVQRYSAHDGLASERVHSLFELANGELWVGTALGLAEKAGERFRSYGAEQGLKGRAVLAIAEDGEGNLWAGVDHGLSRIARHGFATFTTAEGIGELSITELVRSEGELYAVSIQSSSIVLHRYSNGVFSAVRPRYPASIHYFGWASAQSAVRDRAGEWWIATGEGLCRFPRVARFEDLARTPPIAVYTMRDGLRSNDIFRLFEDARGDIWITAISGGGPSRWERATGRLHHYSEADVPGYASRRHTGGIVAEGDPETSSA